MATNFPTSLDVWSDKNASDPIYAGTFTNLQDAADKLEQKVGRDYTASNTTIDYKVSHLVVASCYLYFYENTAPTGWTATLTPGDYVLGVIGDGYAAVGQTATGTWSIDDIGDSTHNHHYMYYSGGKSYTLDENGWATQYGTPLYGIVGNDSLLSYVHTKNTKADTRQLVYNTMAYVDTDNHDHNYSAGWRPQAAVGVIAYYSKT